MKKCSKFLDGLAYENHRKYNFKIFIESVHAVLQKGNNFLWRQYHKMFFWPNFTRTICKPDHFGKPQKNLNVGEAVYLNDSLS